MIDQKYKALILLTFYPQYAENDRKNSYYTLQPFDFIGIFSKYNKE